MKIDHFWRWVLAATFAVCTGAASAQTVGITASGANGLRGSVVAPAANFVFTDFRLLSVDLTIGYDAAVLTLDVDASTIGYGGNTLAFGPLVAGLNDNALGSFFVSSTAGSASISGFLFDPPLLQGALSFNAAFTIAPAAAGGSVTQVSFSGELGEDTLAAGVPYAVLADVAVAAVPEPAAWLLLGVGAAVVAAGRRRRTALR